jgi:hypothetical protein
MYISLLIVCLTNKAEINLYCKTYLNLLLILEKSLISVPVSMARFKSLLAEKEVAEKEIGIHHANQQGKR